MSRAITIAGVSVTDDGVRLWLEQPISRGDRVRDALQEKVFHGALKQGEAPVAMPRTTRRS